jgi:hypothetical protein
LRPEEFLGLARQVRGGMVSLFAFAILQPLPISEPRGGSRRPQAASTFFESRRRASMKAALLTLLVVAGASPAWANHHRQDIGDSAFGETSMISCETV